MRRMVRRLALVGVLAVGGCVTLGGDELLQSDQELIRAGGSIRPGLPMKQMRLPPGYAVTEEFLAADFGRVALTRVESDPSRPLIVFCGGNAFRQDVAGAGDAEQLIAFGDVWTFDYPGFGRSQGEASPAAFEALTRTLSERIDAAFRNGRTGDLVFWGHSFGGGACAELAAAVRTPSHIVLMAAFRDWRAVVRAQAKRFTGPLASLVKPRIAENVPDLDVVEALGDYRGAILVLASRSDRLVPFAVTAELERTLRAAGRRTKLVSFPSADHGRFLHTPGFRTTMQGALAEAGVGASAARGQAPSRDYGAPGGQPSRSSA